jgi:hypothetical protein
MVASAPGLFLLLAACGTTFSGTTLSAQVTSWAQSTSFSSELSAVQGDVRRIDALEPQSASLKTECAVLVNDALIANGNLPTPDLTLTNLLSTAYSVAGEAGHNCLSGAGAGTALLRRSSTERTAARRDMIKALARFDTVTTP